MTVTDSWGHGEAPWMILRRTTARVLSSPWVYRPASTQASYSTVLKGKAKAAASVDVATQLEAQGARILRVVRTKMAERARLMSESVSICIRC